MKVVVEGGSYCGGFSSEDKTKEAGWVAFFLRTGDFFHFSVSWGVALNSVLKLSNLVDVTVSTGGSENSHLSSLRNAWGDCWGAVGGVLNPVLKFSSMSGEGSTGKEESLSLIMFILPISLSSCNKS